VDRRGPGTWCLAVCKSLNLRPNRRRRGVSEKGHPDPGAIRDGIRFSFRVFLCTIRKAKSVQSKKKLRITVQSNLTKKDYSTKNVQIKDVLRDALGVGRPIPGKSAMLRAVRSRSCDRNKPRRKFAF
jgi:hypothetical protein